MKLNQNILDEFNNHLVNVKYKNIIQSLNLKYIEDEQCPLIEVVDITIKKSQRNKGYGSAVMSNITKLADNHNIMIKVYATGQGAAELRALYGFFRKQGLELKKRTNYFLYRPIKRK